MTTSSKRFQVLPYWRTFIVVITPLILLPLPILSKTPGARCGYVILLMAVYWMTEALPLAVTALIPLIGFPLLGVMDTDELSMLYMKEVNMMFLGGLAMAIAVEHCNLHKRIALFVLLHIGQSPRRLMAGFMTTTMFLSMWISNTASTAMMVPVVEAIVIELYLKSKAKKFADTEGEKVMAEEDNDDDDKSITAEGQKMRKALMLAVAYSANIGGTGVVTGTTPNLILMSKLQEEYSDPTGLTFASWMGYNIPGMILCVALGWVWLQILFLGLFQKKNAIATTTKEQELAVRKLIAVKYRALGPITFHESVVFTLFICLIFLWLFRSPEFVPGWAYWFQEAYCGVKVDDATPVMITVMLLFIIPKKLNFWFFRDPNDPSPVEPVKACLEWSVLHEKIPWGVVLLLGGGFAISEAAEVSGLSVWLGEQLVGLSVLPVEATVFIVSLMTAMVTEVASNTATASILMPVLNEMSLSIQVNPLYLMLPAAVCCSYAFMLPVATPPNAIVFSQANMKSTEMMKAGIMMNVLCVLTITLTINTLGVAMFDLRHFPDWANSTISF